MEIDPSKVPTGNINANRKNLLQFTENILNRVTSYKNWPRFVIAFIKICPHFIIFRELLATCQTLAERTEAFFPGRRYKVLSGFLFLRFICPAIVSPNSFGIVDRTVSTNAQKTSSKTKITYPMRWYLGDWCWPLSLSRGKRTNPHSKRNYMAPFNEFISENIAKIESFFAYLLVSKLVQTLSAMNSHITHHITTGDQSEGYLLRREYHGEPKGKHVVPL